MEENEKTIGEYIDVLKRRRWGLILPILITFCLAAIAASVIPPKYQSMSTILIEEQEIPLDFVRTTITGFAEQRLQTLNQRIMSSTRLLEIVNRFNLYAELRQKVTTEEVIDLMRKDIKLATISADISDPQRGGAPSPMTIAFTLSYIGKQPQTVQQVAGVLASLFLEENMKVREERTLGASKFLNEEVKVVQKQMADMDAKIAQYKEKHVTALPELIQVNLANIDRADRETEYLKEQLRTMKEREGYFKSQLLSIPTNAATQDRTLLNDLKAKLVQLQSKFSDKHPDVKKTKSEIAELEKRLDAGPPQKEQGTGKGEQRFSPLDQPDNPAYVNLASQLMSVQSEIETTKHQLDEKEKNRRDYYKRMEASPKVEEAYKGLLAERNNLQLKYDDLMKKAMEARVAQGLEKEKMGERFTIIDPARLPEKPVKPNKLVIMLIGLFLGVGAGAVVASLQEYNDQSVRDPGTLMEVTGVPVLASVPEIVTEKDIKRRKRVRRNVLLMLVILVIVGLICFHYFVMDLDILWATVSRRFL